MPNRTLCNVLEEMRKCYETRNFSGIMGLIEEAQMMGNRMEASLYDKHDMLAVQKKIKELKKERDELKKELVANGKEYKESERLEYYIKE